MHKDIYTRLYTSTVTHHQIFLDFIHKNYVIFIILEFLKIFLKMFLKIFLKILNVSPIVLTKQKNYVSPITLPNQNYVSPLYSVKVLMLLLSKRESCHTHTILIELLQTCIYASTSFQNLSKVN